MSRRIKYRLSRRRFVKANQAGLASSVNKQSDVLDGLIGKADRQVRAMQGAVTRLSADEPDFAKYLKRIAKNLDGALDALADLAQLADDYAA